MRSGRVSPSLPAAESKCKLCPKNWMAYGEKCYGLSKKSWVWNRSKEDCEVWRAQMLTIQDLEEMVMEKAQVARSSWGVKHLGFHLNWIHVGGVGCPSYPKPIHWCVMGGLVPLSSLTPSGISSPTSRREPTTSGSGCTYLSVLKTGPGWTGLPWTS